MSVPLAERASRGTRRSLMMPPRPRKVMLVIHVVVSVAWIGLDACLLVLGVTGVATSDPALSRAAYLALGQLGGTISVPIAIAALATGIALAAGTRWGLVRYRWVLVSLVLTILMTGAVVFALSPILHDAAANAAAAHGPIAAAVGRERIALIVAPSVAIILLSTVAAINIVKPWGRTRWGARS